VVVCLELGADLHVAQLMPLPLIVSCFSKIQIGFAFLVPAHLGSPGKGSLNGCVCNITRYNKLFVESRRFLPILHTFGTSADGDPVQISARCSVLDYCLLVQSYVWPF